MHYGANFLSEAISAIYRQIIRFWQHHLLLDNKTLEATTRTFHYSFLAQHTFKFYVRPSHIKSINNN